LKARKLPEKPTYEVFVGHLRSALHYLYDPVHLRRSPLVAYLGLESVFDQAAEVQRRLTGAIQTLKPAADEPPQSAAWGIYDTLSLLYVRQFPRTMVANQLGISERQLRRGQRQALEALAQILWEQAGTPSAYNPAREGRSPTSGEPLSVPLAEKDQTLRNELDWLETSAPDQRLPLGEVLQTAAGLVSSLAQKMQVDLRMEIDSGLAGATVRQHALRHTLLTLLNAIVPRAGGGLVSIRAARRDNTIEVRVQASGPGHTPAHPDEDHSLDTVARLAAFYGARLEMDEESVLLAFPAPQQIPILVIDDNADWLEMLKRFAAGSPYQIIGVRAPETACSLVKEIQPAVIFLDVMMPGIDGWQVLSDLHNQQAGRPIPIVVCSVLPLEGLALSLGVRAFLQKPVTQDQFLSMVEKMISAAPISGVARHPYSKTHREEG
jgi:CheY-like chemotaxis protein